MRHISPLLCKWPWPWSSVRKLTRVSFKHFSFSSSLPFADLGFQEQMKNETENSYPFLLLSVFQHQNHNAQSGSGITMAKYLIHTHAQGDAQTHRHGYTGRHKGLSSQTQMHLIHRYRHTEMYFTCIFLSLGKNMYYFMYYTRQRSILYWIFLGTKQLISFGENKLFTCSSINPENLNKKQRFFRNKQRVKIWKTSGN